MLGKLSSNRRWIVSSCSVAGLVGALLVAPATAPAFAAADPCGPDGQQDRLREQQARHRPRRSGTSTARATHGIQGFSTDISVNVGSRSTSRSTPTRRRTRSTIYRTGYYEATRRPQDRHGHAVRHAAAEPAAVHHRRHDRALRLRQLGGLRVVERAERRPSPASTSPSCSDARHRRREPHHLHRPRRRQPLRRRLPDLRHRPGRPTTPTAARTSTRAAATAAPTRSATTGRSLPADGIGGRDFYFVQRVPDGALPGAQRLRRQLHRRRRHRPPRVTC